MEQFTVLGVSVHPTEYPADQDRCKFYPVSSPWLQCTVLVLSACLSVLQWMLTRSNYCSSLVFKSCILLINIPTQLKEKSESVLINLHAPAGGVEFSLPSLLGKELLLLTINHVLVSVEIGLLRLHHLGLVEELVAQVESQEQRNTQVSGDEVLVVKAVDEDGEVLEDRDENAKEEGKVGAVGLEGGTPHEISVSVNALGLASSHEENVGDKNGNPSEQAENGHQVDKVAKNGLGRRRDVEVGQSTEASGQSHGVDGKTVLGGSGKDGGSLSVDSKTVEGSSGNVEIGVGGGENEKQKGGVDNVRQTLDTGVGDGNNERRGSGRGGGLLGKGKSGIVIGNVHSQKHDQQNVKEADSVEGQLDGSRHVSSGVLGLSNGDTDELGTKVGEDSSDETGSPGNESALGAVDGQITLLVLLEGTGVFPVSEALSVVIRASSKSENQTQNDKTHNGDNLDGRQPELKLSKELDTNGVDGDNDYQENGNPDSWIHLFSRQPVLDNKSCSSQLVRGDDDVLEPVGVSNSETKARVDESRGVSGESIGKGQVSGHLSEGTHDKVNNKTNKRVSNENGAGSSINKSRTSSNNQTSTQSTTNGNHGDVTGLETSMKLSLLSISEVVSVGGSLRVDNVARDGNFLLKVVVKRLVD